jgi:hypothetical protein
MQGQIILFFGYVIMGRLHQRELNLTTVKKVRKHCYEYNNR